MERLVLVNNYTNYTIRKIKASTMSIMTHVAYTSVE